jgi:hypothetical protein
MRTEMAKVGLELERVRRGKATPRRVFYSIKNNEVVELLYNNRIRKTPKRVESVTIGTTSVLICSPPVDHSNPFTKAATGNMETKGSRRSARLQAAGKTPKPQMILPSLPQVRKRQDRSDGDDSNNSLSDYSGDDRTHNEMSTTSEEKTLNRSGNDSLSDGRLNGHDDRSNNPCNTQSSSQVETTCDGDDVQGNGCNSGNIRNKTRKRRNKRGKHTTVINNISNTNNNNIGSINTNNATFQ